MTLPESLFRDLPDPASARRFIESLHELHPAHSRKLLKDRALLSDVVTLVSYSPLFATTLLQHPEYIAWLGRKRGDSGVRNKDEMLESLARFSLTNSQIEPGTVLSRFRRRELLRIYLRDIRRLGTIAEITEEISNLADAVLEHSLRLARQELDNRFGGPLETDRKGRGRPSLFSIVSLGKLGSMELNYSSDIDLLFIYSDEGMTSGGARGRVTNREYFNKLAETVVRLVGGQAGEGAAYRVDLRLRPHGRVGPLATSLAETVRYYAAEAAQWERQVLIRSRSSAGDASVFRDFINGVAPYVFPLEGSVDEALASVRESKQKIDRGIAERKGFNVKLGTGGIREIEFIAQALQLAYGGRDRWLRAPHTLISLTRLADRGHLTEHELTRLFDVYDFLRKLEHVLQMENGLQTHTIPAGAERRELLARRMGFASFDDLSKELTLRTGSVHRIFSRVFGAADGDVSNAEKSPAGATDSFTDRSDEFHAQAPSAIRPSWEALIPNAAMSLAEGSPRFVQMLRSDPDLAKRIPKPGGQAIERDLRESMLLAVKNASGLADGLAPLRKTWSKLHSEIFLADLLQLIDVRTSKRLQTQLAEASIAAGIELTSKELQRRYRSSFDELPIAVLGLGKLGGGGVDHDSDLDLVMIYDDAEEVRMTDGRLAVTAAEFYSRAVEIFVNALSSITRDGSLYRIDLRLRPHGKDGPAAASRRAFVEYMECEAAIWELLAFVKLRAVGGKTGIAPAIEAEVRRMIHQRAAAIDERELSAETRRVRLGLEEQRVGRRHSRDIDIKYGPGGMLDVFFATRFLQLRDRVPDDPDDRSTGHMLAKLNSAGSLADGDLRAFSAGYEFLSSLDHAIRLAVGRTTRLPHSNKPVMEFIAARMGAASPSSLLERLAIHRLEIRSSFDSVVR